MKKVQLLHIVNLFMNVVTDSMRYRLVKQWRNINTQNYSSEGLTSYVWIVFVFVYEIQTDVDKFDETH